MSQSGSCTNGHGRADQNGQQNESSASSEVREIMKEYWLRYDATPKSMMLCSAANDVLEAEDREQVLQISPSLCSKRVLELGSGIGRFTTELAKLSRTVTAVDFIESYVEKNRELNGHNSHVSFIAADVTELEMPNNSFDVIFTNWLLMYLSDEEVERLVIKMLRWLGDGGHLFIRESCYRQSGDVQRTTNPTYYRSPLQYFRILQNTIYQNNKGQEFSFVCEQALSINAYIKAFLDGQQYTEDGIRRYEFIFGKTYVSTGGQQTTEEFVKRLNLTANDKVLDVGCGIGGSAFHIARKYGSQVHGVDLSSNMISMAVKYQGDMEENVRKAVSFEMSDITKQKCEPGSFDVIYSRDTILHIGDKEELFSNFFKWLKPGGRLLITDYCRGDKEEYSADFLKYVHQRGYHLLTVPEYGHLLEKVGFDQVVADDCTKQFINILHTETKTFAENKHGFLKDFTEQDYDYIFNGWKAKVERCSSGDQAWGFFQAVKPQ